MILSSSRIRELILDQENPLISPVPENRLKDIEGSSYDLTLARISLVTPLENPDTLPVIGNVYRKMAQHRDLPIHQSKGRTLTPFPKQMEHDNGTHSEFMPMYLLYTVETITLPPNIMGLVFSKVTMWEDGISLETAPIKPGYSGTLSFGATVCLPVSLLQGARIATAVFFQVGPGETDPYSGKRGGSNPSLTGTQPER